jgi:hypothetical protein
MFDFEPGRHGGGSGITRRDFLRAGGLSALGLTLPGVLRAQSIENPKSKIQNSCILLWMGGGPSHMDTFDPKPEAPPEIRGEFRAIPTNVGGIRISEMLPKLAQQMDSFSILRSVTSPDGTHETATRYLLTGHPFCPAQEYPAYGSVVAWERGMQNGMPPYVFLGGRPFGHGGGGCMGAVCDPVSIVGDPNDPNQAGSLLTSPASRKAFDLKHEPDRLRDRYGRSYFGQSCLLARRFVEAGARFVAIHYGGWDTHENNFSTLKNYLLPTLDRGYAALLSDLKERGMLDSTVVVWMGEFGRAPRVNASAGRDHWPRVMCVCIGGGGIKTGQVIGASDKHAEVPEDRPVRVEDVAATLYTALGIDCAKTYMTPQNGAVRINCGGQPIRELL